MTSQKNTRPGSTVLDRHNPFSSGHRTSGQGNSAVPPRPCSILSRQPSVQDDLDHGTRSGSVSPQFTGRTNVRSGESGVQSNRWERQTERYHSGEQLLLAPRSQTRKILRLSPFPIVFGQTNKVFVANDAPRHRLRHTETFDHPEPILGILSTSPKE